MCERFVVRLVGVLALAFASASCSGVVGGVTAPDPPPSPTPGAGTVQLMAPIVGLSAGSVVYYGDEVPVTITAIMNGIAPTEQVSIIACLGGEHDINHGCGGVVSKPAGDIRGPVSARLRVSFGGLASEIIPYVHTFSIRGSWGFVEGWPNPSKLMDYKSVRVDLQATTR
jgi:hypothetical protein